MVFEYAPAPESRDVATVRESYGLFIDGAFTSADDTASSYAVIDPATEGHLGLVTETRRADVDAAVRSARRAYEGAWSAMSGGERARHLYRLARLVQERSRELAVLQTLETGTPVRQSRDADVPAAVAHLFHHAGWADKLRYAVPGHPDPRPGGVVALILGRHSPVLSLTRMIAPALAAGNTVVLKPAATTPLTALLLAEICQQADLPAGVVNVLTGSADAGDALVSHPGLDHVAFAGSPEVARAVSRQLAGRTTTRTLDVRGGTSHLFFDDAPVDDAVEGIIGTLTRGDSARLLVQESEVGDVLERLRRRMSTLRVGDPLDNNTDVGPVRSAAQLARVEEFVAEAQAEGGERWSVGSQLPEQGFWFPPTLVTGGSRAHVLAREDVPGPVLAVATFRTLAEAAAKANNVPSVFSASVWTEKGSRGAWLADRLRAQVVWLNAVDRADPTAPTEGRDLLETYLR